MQGAEGGAEAEEGVADKKANILKNVRLAMESLRNVIRANQGNAPSIYTIITRSLMS